MALVPDPRPQSLSGTPATILRLTGADALAILHRISTQSVVDLEPGSCRVTLFCDFRGRLLHRAAVARVRDGAVWLVREDAPAEELAAHLDRHIFRENVRVEEDAAHRGGVRAVPGGFGLAAGTVVEQGGAPFRLEIGPSFGLEVGERSSDPDAERLRILAGRPRHGHEIAPAFNPFEVGLAHEVHLDKGCFTGQEALLRLVTYGGVRRRLAIVTGTGGAPGVPRDILDRGKVAGVLTSAAGAGPGWSGLAVIRNEALDGPPALEVAGAGPVGSPQVFPVTRPAGLP